MGWSASKPQIVGAHEALTARQSKTLLERPSAAPGDSGVVERHRAIEQAVAESRLIAGNRTRILCRRPRCLHRGHPQTCPGISPRTPASTRKRRSFQ
jgi:hypothetical protein